MIGSPAVSKYLSVAARVVRYFAVFCVVFSLMPVLIYVSSWGNLQQSIELYNIRWICVLVSGWLLIAATVGCVVVCRRYPKTAIVVALYTVAYHLILVQDMKQRGHDPRMVVEFPFGLMVVVFLVCAVVFVVRTEVKKGRIRFFAAAETSRSEP